MPGAVKRRAYTSAVRARRAEKTRERVLTAARRLFRRRGYVGTTVEDIARLARVVPATVYLAFGSKRTIALALVASVGTRPEAVRLNAAILAEPDLRRRLALAARITRVITEDAWDLMLMFRAGAATDTDLAEAWRRGTEGRHESVAHAIGPLARAARSELSADEVVDLVWALTGPDLYGALVVERGWSPARYERILSEMLVSTLLPSSHVGARRGPRPRARS